MGWTKAQEFNETGDMVTIPGSATGNTPGQAILATRNCPNGARAFLEKFSAKVVDLANSDQIYFSLLRNGSPIGPGYERVSGIQFDFSPQFELGVDVGPGEISIVGYNISGMNTAIEPNASAVAADVRCQAWWQGSLLTAAR